MLRRYQVWSCNADAAGPRSVQAENREQAMAQARRFQPGEPLVVVDAEPWDGKDGVPIEEESLEDIMGWDDDDNGDSFGDEKNDEL